MRAIQVTIPAGGAISVFLETYVSPQIVAYSVSSGTVVVQKQIGNEQIGYVNVDSATAAAPSGTLANIAASVLAFAGGTVGATLTVQQAGPIRS